MSSSHSRKSSLSNGASTGARDEFLKSLDGMLTPGLDTAQLAPPGSTATLTTNQLFEASVEDDVIVRRDLQFTLPVHSPLLRSARTSIALAVQEEEAAPMMPQAASLSVSRSQLLSTPIQAPPLLQQLQQPQQQQQQQQINSSYIRMCAQLESFVDRETELADELLMNGGEQASGINNNNNSSIALATSNNNSTASMIDLTPELERARLNDDYAASASAQAPPKRRSSIPTGSTRSLWLGNLDPTLTEADLHAVFAAFGPIELIRLLPAKECAFVNFYVLDDALRAREAMNGRALGNLVLRIGFGKIDAIGGSGSGSAAAAVSRNSGVGQQAGDTAVTHASDSRSIWIGNVGPEVTEEDLLQHFSHFGVIESCRVLSGKSCAFVNFYESECANAARVAMNGAVIGSSMIKTGYAKEGNSERFNSSDRFNNDRSNSSDKSTCNNNLANTTQTPPAPTFASIIAGNLPSPSTSNSNSSNSSTTTSPAAPFDNGTLREYRRAVECNPEHEIPRVLQCLATAPLASLATDSYGNILLQKIIERATPEQQMHVVEALGESLHPIGMSKNGTWVVQKLLQFATPPLQEQLIQQRLAPHAVAMLEDQFGNYVIQVALQTEHPAGEEIVAAICAHARRLATGRFSSRALRSILDLSRNRHIIAALAREAVWLAIDPNGAIVLQWILDCRELPGRMSLVGAALQGRLAQIALTKQGSAVVARLIAATDEPAARDAAIAELCADGPELDALLREGPTCAILCKAFQMAKPSLRLQLAASLAPRLLVVLQQLTGLSVQQLTDPAAAAASADIPLHLARLHQEVILTWWCKCIQSSNEAIVQ